MIKAAAVFLLSTVIVGFAQAQVMCSKNNINVSGIQGTVQCDYRHELSKHFKQSGSVYNFWGY